MLLEPVYVIRWAGRADLRPLKESTIIAHVRNIKILTYSEAFGAKLPFFSRLYCLVIPRRDLNTKKTKPNIERKWTKRLNVMLEF